MRLSHAVSPSRPISVQFAEDVLNVRYRPPSATVAEMQAAGEGGSSEERARSIIDFILKVVESWDLTEEDGETLVPLDAERLMHIPVNIFHEIISAVKADQSTGEAESSSDAG